MEEVFLDIARGRRRAGRRALRGTSRRDCRRARPRCRVVDRQRGVVRVAAAHPRADPAPRAICCCKSWPRIVSMTYYPTVTMVLWAFVTLYLAPTNQLPARRAGILHRRRAAVGRAVSRPARRVADVHRGDVRAQPRQPVRQSAAPATNHRRPAHDEPAAHADRRRRRVRASRGCCSATRSSRSGLPLVAFFANLLVFGWAIGLAVSGDDPALGPGRRRARVGGDLPRRAGFGRLLPDRRAAGVAAAVS